MTQKTTQNPWQFDVRVRERNLKQGSLTDKELEKHLSGLPDLADHVDAFGTAQPALEQPRVAPAPAPAPVVASALESGDDLDEDEEEDEDEDEDEDDVAEEPVAAAPEAARPGTDEPAAPPDADADADTDAHGAAPDDGASES